MNFQKKQLITKARNTSKMAIILLIFILMLWALLGNHSSVQASSGSLKMNNQVIYEKQEEEQYWKEITYIIPNLFLPTKTTIEEQLKHKEQELRLLANEANFSDADGPKLTSSSQIAREQLFIMEISHSPRVSSDDLDNAIQGTKVLNIVWIVIGGMLIGIGGIVLGTQYSYRRNKR